MSDKWFYVNASGDTIGPVTSGVLKKLVDEGIIVPSTVLVSEDGTKEFEAGKVSALFKDSDQFSSGVFSRGKDRSTTDRITGQRSPASGETRSLTPLPSAKTLPLAPGSRNTARTTIPSPPTPEMPLAPANPFDAGIPMPVTLSSQGTKIVRPNQSHWKDNILIWTIAGLGVLFLFGAVLANFTWKMAVQHASEMEGRLPKYQGRVEQKTVTKSGDETTTFAVASAPTAEEILAVTEQSIAQITGPVSCGTGFVVAPGLLATNSHVIAAENIESLTVVFPAREGAERGPFTPRLRYEDTVRDIALLEIAEVAIAPLKIATDHGFRRAQRVMTIGNPGRGDGVVLENAVSAGILSTRTEIDGQLYYQLSIAVNPGNSGGPVLDDAGNVLGILSLKSVKTPSMAYCIPAKDLVDAVELEKTLTAQDRRSQDEKHASHAAVRQGRERTGHDSIFGDENNDRGDENRSVPDFGHHLDMVKRVDISPENDEQTSLPQPPDEEQDARVDSHHELRYRQILAKEKWTFNETPLYGNIVGFKNGIVLIRLKDSTSDEAPLERYARRFSASDINDILFYARYNGIPTGNLGRR